MVWYGVAGQFFYLGIFYVGVREIDFITRKKLTRKRRKKMSLMGKVFRVGLNAVTPKYTKAWASPNNTGLKKLINGTQKEVGHSIIFQQGLKHAIVRTGYRDSLKAYHNMSVSAFSTGEQLAKVYNNVPRCLQQAMTELSEWMSHGCKV